jgi:hypothetical protein
VDRQAFLSREDVPDGEFQGGGLAIPNQLVLADDTSIKTELDRSSPYTIQRDGEGRHVLCRQGEPVTAVSFLARPDFEETPSDGSPIDGPLGQRAEHCVAVVRSVFFEYASSGVDLDFSCHQCVTHKTCQDYPRSMGLSG